MHKYIFGRKKIYRIIFLLPACILFLLLLNIDTAYAEKDKVYWGGVGFTGTWSDRDQLYPFSSRLLCNSQNKCSGKPKNTIWGGNIDAMARERIAKKTFDNIEIDMSLIEDTHQGTIMAVGITGEMLGITKTHVNKKETYQHVFRIFGGLMFYEYESGKVIKNIPIIVKFTTFLDSPANDDIKHDIIKNVLGTNDLNINFFDILYQQAKSVNLNNLPSKYSQITEIILNSGVSKIMSKRLSDNNFKMFIAQFMEAEFVSRADAPLLPSSIGGDVIKQKLKARFADAERELTLSEAAFEIGLNVRTFKKFEKISSGRKTVCHAVAVTLKMGDEDRMFLDNSIKFSRTKDSCGIASIEQNLDQTFYFPESLFSLIQNITKQYGNSGPDKDWLRVNAKGTADAFDQIIEGRDEAFSGSS